MIKALPEGSRVNLKVPFFTIQNTHPDFFWLTNYLETALSNEIWKPTTVATIAFEFRRVLDNFVELTGSSPDFANWQNHDFSMRGMSGLHDASSACAGHLLSNSGTDTISAIDYLENYYNADAETELVGGSVPATEHSVMCAGGADDEQETIRRLIQDIYPSGVVSVVSDTWDFWNVITNTTKNLKEVILGRTPNSLGQAKVVFRPDSGNPVKILTGYTYFTPSDLQDNGCDESTGFELAKVNGRYYKFTTNSCNSHGLVEYFIELGQEVPEHEVKGAVECLWDIFRGTVTPKGFKTLNDRVGLIYGDSITLERQHEILFRLMKKGFSAGNVVFGIGSYTYQYITRDTFGMAMKATFACVNGVDRELFKDPVTDSGGVKKSAKGLLRVEKQGNEFVLYDRQTREQEQQGALELVFHNSKLVRDMTFSQICDNLKSSIES
jgi:nicotinamide phosphoribosyltransferase